MFSCQDGESPTYLRSRSNIILPDQLSIAAAYLSFGAEMKSTLLWRWFSPGSLKMTKALSRLSKLFEEPWTDKLSSRFITSNHQSLFREERGGETNGGHGWLSPFVLIADISHVRDPYRHPHLADRRRYRHHLIVVSHVDTSHQLSSRYVVTSLPSSQSIPTSWHDSIEMFFDTTSNLFHFSSGYSIISHYTTST